MPLKYFSCLDGIRTEISTCLSGKCRMGSRCAPISFLKHAGEQREWLGCPSTTQLLNGTRESYLLIKENYCVRPYSRAFAILGTGAHGFLDTDDEFSYSEERLRDNIASGQFDRLEQQENGEWWLIEMKTSGSGKIKRALGLVPHKKPMLLPNGEPVLYQRSGKGYKAGDQKQETFWVPEGIPDMRDWELQQNRNRMLIESQLNIKVDKMKVFGIIRDANTQSAIMNGIKEECKYFDVPFMDDEVVKNYFTRKAELLLKHLAENTVPPVCTDDERWKNDDGFYTKCQYFCSVAEFCVR